ncbi:MULTISPECIES: hypothetical protein [Rhodopseudomonas]|uniref:Uncharacterized protein n=1 Tax=Rhodopseudomonas palustris TaxID=1076 RepID=A0A0D7F582_RHOPL|nr:MULTISPECIES: hypothetical protein [Rhodopseudomonas]KIZ47951.1 hypothetical protein OO17_01510 [Rhodopseudomonas palustris]MDF3811152.1 hypothetical protein [Rhodopseudomonas sp. BAL398]WOK16777.1 hypothetical protein RBJ75_21960 [Rhodopseudomonas sp. BAL398]
MSDAFIIEVKSTAIGLVVRDGRGFRFHAACDEFHGLDGRAYRSPDDAQKAAIRHAAQLAATRLGGRAARLQPA